MIPPDSSIKPLVPLSPCLLEARSLEARPPQLTIDYLQATREGDVLRTAYRTTVSDMHEIMHLDRNRFSLVFHNELGGVAAAILPSLHIEGIGGGGETRSEDRL